MLDLPPREGRGRARERRGVKALELDMMLCLQYWFFPIGGGRPWPGPRFAMESLIGNGTISIQYYGMFLAIKNKPKGIRVSTLVGREE